MYERRSAFCRGARGATGPELDRLSFDNLLAACSEAVDELKAAVSEDERDAVQKLHAPTIVGGRTEYYLDGEHGRSLLQRALTKPNTLVPGETLGPAWAAWRGLLESRVREELARQGVDEPVEFSGYSLIVQPEGSSQQWLHADMLNGGQGVVALQDNAPSTLVYAGPYYAAADADRHLSPTERSVRDGESTTTQGLPRQLFLDAVATPALLEVDAPTESVTLQRGEFSLLTGPVVHAGPGYEGRRMVLFFTFNRIGGAKYDTNEQYGPVNCAIQLNSAELIAATLAKWAAYNPFQFMEKQESSKKDKKLGKMTLWEIVQEWAKNSYRLPPDAVELLREHHTAAG